MTNQTSQRFLACLPFILKEEGGYSNTPGDHGGATNYGIIQREYNLYLDKNDLPPQSVRLITPDQYREIYWDSYWMPHCPELPAGLDLSVFNINVNGGPSRGTKLLQRCLAITPDGVWGPLTTAAVTDLIASGDVRAVIVAFHAAERAFYQGIINNDSSQHKFASDWFGRNDRCEAASLAMLSESPGLTAALDDFTNNPPKPIMTGKA
jgi:lysozyme family protein